MKILQEPELHCLSIDTVDYKVVDYGLLFAKRKYYPRVKVDTSNLAYKYVKSIPIVQSQMEVREFFGIIHLNNQNYAVGFNIISLGGIKGTVADPRLIFKLGLDMLSSGIILFHNHPSGNLKPSETDIRLTKTLSDLGKMMEIAILDHLIITEQGYFSFVDENIL